jgi:hypothetical protein
MMNSLEGRSCREEIETLGGADRLRAKAGLARYTDFTTAAGRIVRLTA